jgi:hypothetical protein
MRSLLRRHYFRISRELLEHATSVFDPRSEVQPSSVRLSMSLTPQDLTLVYKATIAKGTGAMRGSGPCSSIICRMRFALAGRDEDDWRKYMEDNPIPATHGAIHEFAGEAPWQRL